MSEIEELQSRITAALDRIGAGIETLDRQPAPTEAEADTGLAAALEEEKLANRQLEERLKSIKVRHEEDMQALRSELDQSEKIDELNAGIEELRAENARLQADLEDASRAEEVQAELDRVRSEADTQATALARLDMDIQRVRQSNDQLRAVNDTLRRANEEGVGDPHLINKAMLAELEALRASRATDAAEAGAVLSKLETLLAHAANLPEGEDD